MSGALSVTVGNNANRLMIFRWGNHQGGTVSNVQYNSVAMTKLVEKVGSFSENVSIWGLLAPSTGTHNVTWTNPGNFLGVAVDSLYNVDQSGLPSVTQSATGNSGTASLSITPGSNNNWILDVVEAEAAVTVVSNTQDYNLTGQSFENVAGSEFQQSTAAAHTMSWTLASGQRWNQAAIAVVPAAAGGAAYPGFLTLVGAGM